MANLTFYGWVSVARAAFVPKAADEIRIRTIFEILQNKESEPVVTSNELTYNFEGLVTRCVRPNVASGSSIGQH